MRKRIILITFTVVALFSLAVVLYQQFKPQTSALTLRADSPSQDQVIELTNLQSFATSNPGKHVLFLGDNQANTEYVLHTLLAPLKTELETNPTPQLVDIDMTNVKDVSVTRLKKLVGVEKYPAFVIINTNQGGYDISSVLVFDESKPFTSEDLKTWFYENGLWTGPYNLEKASK